MRWKLTLKDPYGNVAEVRVVSTDELVGAVARFIAAQSEEGFGGCVEWQPLDLDDPR